jgi:hypothetical protein
MSKLRSLWQKIRRWLFIVLGCIGVCVVLLALVYGVIRFGWGWTGFTGGYSQETVKGTTEDKVYLSSKTLWDWMQLLLVPIMLAIGGFWLNHLQKSREERTVAQREKTDREIAADNQREVALQAYIDKIGELLLREHLGELPGNPQVENIARARTVTVLRILDPDRRASLLQFLERAHILRICIEGILIRIDLHEANLVALDLSKFYFTGANLFNANLSGASLNGVNLSGANFGGADLSGTDLTRAKGLTDEQRVKYQSRGARVDPISSALPVQSTVPPATSSTPQSDNSQDQAVPPVQAGGTSSFASNTVPPIQGEGVDDSSTSPTQSGSLP